MLSDTPESLRQGGDRGNFRMVLHGEDDSSVNLLLNRQEAFFEPGRTYHFITTTNNLGKAMKSTGLLLTNLTELFAQGVPA